MRLNPSKELERERYHLKMGSECHYLAESEAEKDLGVVFDKKLDFQQHIDNKINMANRMADLIRRTYKFLDKKNFPTL